METVPSKTGSFAKRRKMFKDVWYTSETNKYNVNSIKTPIIRTARIGDQDIISKRKKQRIRNLRTVCKKILHFCDREENDIYGRMASARAEKEIEDFFKTFKPQLVSPSNETEENVKKTQSGYMSTELMNGTNSSTNNYDLKFPNNASTQNNLNRNINTNALKTAQQGKRKPICYSVYIKNPTPREVYTMHTIHIPELL